MSKSAGNSVFVKDLLKDFSPEALRLLLLNRHYRKPLDFSPEKLSSAQTALVRLHRRLHRLGLKAGGEDFKPTEGVRRPSPSAEVFRGRFLDFLAQDINTAAACAFLFDTVKKMESEDASNRKFDPVFFVSSDIRTLFGEVFKAGAVLGIINPCPVAFLSKWAPH